MSTKADRSLDGRQSALVALGRALRDAGYRFVTPTPETHRRVVQRPDRARARDLRDVSAANEFEPDPPAHDDFGA